MLKQILQRNISWIWMNGIVIVFNFPFSNSRFTSIKNSRMFSDFTQIHCTCNSNSFECRTWREYICKCPVFQLLRSSFTVIVRVKSRINSISQDFAVFRVHYNYGSTFCMLFINHFLNFFFANVLNCRINC